MTPTVEISSRIMKVKAAVLIVDDEKIIREVLARSVIREGYSVEQATDGRNAMDKLALSPFDIVITDIKMPIMDGMELVKKISVQYPDISIIVITAYADSHTPADTLEAGADRHITKPFKSYEIAEALHAVFAKLAQRRHTITVANK